MSDKAQLRAQAEAIFKQKPDRVAAGGVQFELQEAAARATRIHLQRTERLEREARGPRHPPK